MQILCWNENILLDVKNLVCLPTSLAEVKSNNADLTRAGLIHDAAFGCFIRFEVHQS